MTVWTSVLWKMDIHMAKNWPEFARNGRITVIYESVLFGNKSIYAIFAIWMADSSRLILSLIVVQRMEKSPNTGSLRLNLTSFSHFLILFPLKKGHFFYLFFCFSPDCTFSSSRVMLKRPKKSLIVHTANIFLEGYTIWLLHILIQAEQKRSWTEPNWKSFSPSDGLSQLSSNLSLLLVSKSGWKYCYKKVICLKSDSKVMTVQPFLDFRGFHFRNFWFNTVYNPKLFASPKALLKHQFTWFLLPRFFVCVPKLTA